MLLAPLQILTASTSTSTGTDGEVLLIMVMAIAILGGPVTLTIGIAARCTVLTDRPDGLPARVALIAQD